MIDFLGARRRTVWLAICAGLAIGGACIALAAGAISVSAVVDAALASQGAGAADAAAFPGILGGVGLLAMILGAAGFVWLVLADRAPGWMDAMAQRATPVSAGPRVEPALQASLAGPGASET